MISSTVWLILKTIFIIKYVHFHLNNWKKIQLFCEVELWGVGHTRFFSVGGGLCGKNGRIQVA